MNKIELIKQYRDEQAARGVKVGLADAKAEVERRLASGEPEVGVSQLNADSSKTPKAAQKSSNPQKRDISIAFITAVIGTWLISQFLLQPLLEAFETELSWWMYVLLFVMAFGSSAEALAKQRAHQNLAYGPVKTAPVTLPSLFCSHCGRPMDGSDAFCPGCGAKVIV